MSLLAGEAAVASPTADAGVERGESTHRAELPPGVGRVRDLGSQVAGQWTLLLLLLLPLLLLRPALLLPSRFRLPFFYMWISGKILS